MERYNSVRCGDCGRGCTWIEVAFGRVADPVCGRCLIQRRKLMKREKPGNARFWDWIGEGFVKLTLRPGQVISRERGGPTDEGYSHMSETWEHTGDGVRYEYTTFSRDCDGRFDTGGEFFCPLGQLAAVEADEEGRPARPAWEKEGSRQRDYAAEAAGY